MFGNKSHPYEKSKKEPEIVSTNASAGAEVIQRDNNWIYDEREDKMTSQTIYTATTFSSDLLHFDYPYDGGSTASLIIRYKDGLTEVMLQVDKGQFIPTLNSGKVRVRFGNDKPTNYSISAPTDYSNNIIFIGNRTEFIHKLIINDTVIIEAEFYKEGRRPIEFNIKNIRWNLPIGEVAF